MKKSIFAVSSTLLLAIMLVLPSQSNAKTANNRQATSSQPPFVGTRYFNFDGGTGTERSITLPKMVKQSLRRMAFIRHRHDLSRQLSKPFIDSRW